MNVEIVWHPAALATLYRIHWKTAGIIDAGIIGLAERGEGVLERVPPYHHLRVGAHIVRLVIEREPLRMTIIGIYRAR